MSTAHEHFDLDRLKAISVSEVARRLGDNLKRAGTVYKTLCPWHDDKHPSLTLYERTGENRCHCFSCGKGGSVVDFVMQHEQWTFREACQWLSYTFGIATDSPVAAWPNCRPKPTAKPSEPAYTYIPMPMVDSMVSAESSLCRCLALLFQPEAVVSLAEEYRLGTYALNGQDDYTVFPSIDHQNRVCNLKVQHYDTDLRSPTFGHSQAGTTFWLGAMWAREGRLPRESVFRSSCLFGEHLLSRYPNSTVALVESPKNALFGALAFPQYTWLATGSKGMLKRSSLLPLRGRNVIVVPDCDAVDEWAQTLRGLADLANFVVSDFCRREAPEGQPKYDVADYLQQRLMPF